MKPNTITKGKLETVNDKISSTVKSEPQVVKITRKTITTQPVTTTYISKKVVTTTTVNQPPVHNTRYNNTASSNIQNITKINTTNYTRITLIIEILIQIQIQIQTINQCEITKNL